MIFHLTGLRMSASALRILNTLMEYLEVYPTICKRVETKSGDAWFVYYIFILQLS
jgi:hypothetical protein